MSRKKKRVTKKKLDQVDLIKSVRKPMPPRTRVHKKDLYNRRDQNWKDDVDEG